MTPQQFATAIGAVESNNNPNSPLGDHGRAFGQFQVHPDWVFDWARRLALAPQLGELWDSFIERLVCAFYSFHVSQLSAPEIAMTFHIGHVVHFGGADWDAGYGDRFSKAAAGLPRG